MDALSQSTGGIVNNTEFLEIDLLSLATGGSLSGESLIFPTLSKWPVADDWGNTLGQDPVIRTKFESGGVSTRPRFSRALREWTLAFRHLEREEKNIIRDFEKFTFYGAKIFQWYDHIEQEMCNVRFAEPVKFRLESNGVQWKVSIKFREA